MEIQTQQESEDQGNMANFHELLFDVHQNGIDQDHKRTGIVCRTSVGVQLKYNLQHGYPAITSKRFHFKGMRGELLGFFRGYDNAADFRALGCNVWNDNANKTEGWLKNFYRKGTDDLGRIYSKQWTEWEHVRICKTRKEYEYLLNNGFTAVVCHNGVFVVKKVINQLEEAVRKLLTDPTDRRIIVEGWNVGELDMMALPPCHKDYTFIALDDPEFSTERQTLHVVMTIR